MLSLARGEIVFGHSRNSPNSSVTKADDEVFAYKMNAKHNSSNLCVFNKTISQPLDPVCLSCNLPQSSNGG